MKISDFLNAEIAKVSRPKARQAYAPVTRKFRDKTKYRRNKRVDTD